VSLTPGIRIGPYAVTAKLGAGGMGEVYRATDTTLGREVAIKVLPASVAQDADRLARFDREARTLATLNHPYIAQIYGRERSGNTSALVMELVEGPTLADRIMHGALPVGDALSIATQIAEALEAAHEQGVVHRDLKPANVKVRLDGVVKVLDFGLAKAIEPVGAAVASASLAATVTSPAVTHAGIILGTAAYMSPEQARGRPVDKRADIWAFGCVLYEMLAGVRPFAGETVSDLIAAVIDREPDWKALPAGVPSNVLTLLKRCLDKDAKRRLRDIGDARLEVDEAIKAPVARDASDGVRPGVTWRRWVAPVAIAIAGLVALAVGLRSGASREEAWVSPLANAKFTRLTDFPGTETLGAISPDGRFVAYLSDQAGPFNLWLNQVDTGRFENLTKDLPTLSFNLNVRAMGFTGDGSEVSFLTGGRRVLMPLIGGMPRPFLQPTAQHPSWSPDGARLVYVQGVDGDPIFVADRTGSNAREIFKDQRGVHNHNPVWAPDSQWIYFVHGLDVSGEMEVWRIRPSGGAPEQITRQGAAITYIAPLGPRTLLYVAPAEDRSGPWLWALDVESRVSRRVSAGLERYRSVATSSDGRRVVATVANPTANLWRVPLLDRVADDRDIRPFAVQTVRALMPRFRGTSVFYLSARGTGDGLWRYEDGQASEIWKGSDGALAEPPAVSPDGRRVVFVIRKAAKGQLTLLSADGSESRVLADSIDAQGAADWAPDGRRIVTGGRDAQDLGLFVIPLDGGPPVRLATGLAINPVWSPDGSLIVYAGTSVAGRQLLAAVRHDGTPVELPEIQVPTGNQAHRFLPNGTGIVYMQSPGSGGGSVGPFRDLWLLNLATKATRHLAHLTGDYQTLSFDITPDGKQIIFDRVNDNSDVVLIEIPR
jgi:Tol biopolymer transport system component